MKKLFAFFWDKSLLIFALIGLGNTLLTQVGIQLMLQPMTDAWGSKAAYWASSAIMFFLCSVISFVLNRRFSFESKAPLLQSIIRFAVVIAVCYLISFGLSDIIVPSFMRAFFPGVPEMWVTRIASLFAQVVFTACNYIGQRLWAFKE